MEDERITDGKLSSSSSESSYPAKEGRLNGPTAWIPPSSDSSPWIQVDFGLQTHVAGIRTQGRADGNQNQWVTEYKLQWVVVGSHSYWPNLQNSRYSYVSRPTTYFFRIIL